MPHSTKDSRNDRNPQRGDERRPLDPASACGYSSFRQRGRKDTVTAPNGAIYPATPSSPNSGVQHRH